MFCYHCGSVVQEDTTSFTRNRLNIEYGEDNSIIKYNCSICGHWYDYDEETKVLITCLEFEIFLKNQKQKGETT